MISGKAGISHQNASRFAVLVEYEFDTRFPYSPRHCLDVVRDWRPPSRLHACA
jgi:hypothetical protein